MLFSSITFIYYFLPILLIIYFATKNKYKNLVLFLFSLIFYFYGEKEYTLILIFSCIFNYLYGFIISKHKNKILLAINIIINLSLLIFFKYADFFIANINTIFDSNIGLLHVVIPIGISFFTFQSISYVIDVYRENVEHSKKFINYACYICMFPQLIAGPIVRYKDINNELIKREHSYENFSYGISRFIIGLSKKVIIANDFSEAISLIGDINTTFVSSWLVAIFYTLQIYYDFSGYSDMAIGLGRILGFHFLENFNYPLIASSITDFWRRWHISLSSWFKDYVYIPLKGNRVSLLKWIRNVFIVWFITGFWHGASYNFILWGLYFAVFLIIEKKLLSGFLNKHKIISHIYSFLIIIISFVIFSSTDLTIVSNSLKNMFLINKIDFIDSGIIYYLKSYLILFIIALIGSTPLINNIYIKFKESKTYKRIYIIEPIILIVLLILVTSILIDSSFNPFLYFRF